MLAMGKKNANRKNVDFIAFVGVLAMLAINLYKSKKINNK